MQILYTATQAAAILNIPTRTVQARAKALGVGQQIGAHRNWHFTPADLKRLAQPRRRGPKPRKKGAQ